MTKNEISSRLDKYFFDQLSQFPLAPYHVMTWSRDCDMCESTSVRVYHTYVSLVRSYASYIDGLEWSEGPSSWQIVESQPEVSHVRDRVMESFENGNGFSVLI
jgi:hypothetical protein